MQHIVIDRPRQAIEQFITGLNLTNIVPLVEKYPDEARTLFCSKQNASLTAKIFGGLFVVHHAEMGTTRRAIENPILAFWRDYLQNCEGD